MSNKIIGNDLAAWAEFGHGATEIAASWSKSNDGTGAERPR